MRQIQNLLIGCGIVFVAGFGCTDEDPKPQDTADINDLLGIWVSVDSILVPTDSNYTYIRNTLEFDTSSYVSLGKKFAPHMIKGGHKTSEYKFLYFGQDSLHLWYMGPTKMGFVNNLFKHKIHWNANKDTLIIDNFKTTYEPSPFNRFVKE